MKNAVQIKENVYWVGVRDAGLRHFHGYHFPIDEGTTYNAYLIVDKQVTLIDTVEEDFVDEMFERIESVLNGRSIDNIIIQHAEPDHASGFMKFMQKYPDAKCYASSSGIANMHKQFFEDYDFTSLKTNDEICTGQYNLSFIEMQMIHWPDNMLTYLKEHKLAFTSDAFGQHIVSYKMFDKDHSLDYILNHLKDYYANIMFSYHTQIQNKLKLVKELDIEMIAPAHGIILEKYVKEIIDAYDYYSSNTNKDKVVIVYESVWKHTNQIADALAQGLAYAGLEVKVYQYSTTSKAIIMKELLDSKAIMVGSGTYNNFMADDIAGFLEKLISLKLVNKSALGFGAYGWYNKIPDKIDSKLVEANLTLLDDNGLAKNFTPSKESINEIIEFAQKIGKKLIEQ